MTTYEYYLHNFAFRTIPEEAFDRVVERARAVLKKYESIYTVKKYNLTEELALYHMAEEIYLEDMRQDVVQRTVGSVSVRYGSAQTLEKRLFRIAGRYLKIYRGVES